VSRWLKSNARARAGCFTVIHIDFDIPHSSELVTHVIAWQRWRKSAGDHLESWFVAKTTTGRTRTHMPPQELPRGLLQPCGGRVLAHYAA